MFKNQIVAITGAAGTVGAELTRRLLVAGVKEIRALDNNESGLFDYHQFHSSEQRVKIYCTDVRDGEMLAFLFRDADVVIHAAALKHVFIAERVPLSAVQTNIIGVQNVIQAVTANNVRRLMFLSSDKAVNPTNVMGTSKLMGERLVTAVDAFAGVNAHTVFSSVRFGNVAGSRGSVIPLFCQQIEQGGPVTLTDPVMTRFMMTIGDAVDLVLDAIRLSRGGEVFVAKMPVVKIQDLAEEMVSLLTPILNPAGSNIRIEVVGPRPGEKLYEELISLEEQPRSLDGERLLIVLPALKDFYTKREYHYPDLRINPVRKQYVSSQFPPLSRGELRTFLLMPGVLPEPLRMRLLKVAK